MSSQIDGNIQVASLINKRLLIVVTIFLLVVLLSTVIFWQLPDTQIPLPNPLVIERPMSNQDLHINQNIKDIRNQIDQLLIANRQPEKMDVSMINKEFSEVKEIIYAMSTALQEQEKYLKMIEKNIDKNKKQLLELNETKPNTKDMQLSYKDLLIFNKPPFRLLAVEYWEDMPTAILALHDKTKSVHKGDYVANWKILRIDALNREIEVSHKSDLLKVMTLEVGG